MNAEVRAYMAEIGRKGGRAGKGTDWRKEVCRHAAVVRWRTYREQKRAKALKAEAKKRERKEDGFKIQEQPARATGDGVTFGSADNVAPSIVEDAAPAQIPPEAAPDEQPIIPRHLLQ